MPDETQGTTKEKCTAKSTTTGKRCGKWPVRGSTVCEFHGGNAPQVKAKAKQRLETEKAAKAAKRLAVHLEADENPVDVLLAELRGSRALAAYWEDRLADSGDDASVVAWVHTENGSYPGGLSVEAQLWQAERNRAIAVAKTCIQLGLEERRVRLAERDGAQIAAMIGSVLRQLGVFDDPRAPDIVRAELRKLEQGDAVPA
jgi:hypothetical protein